MLKKLKRIGAAIALLGMGVMALLLITVLPSNADTTATETPLTPLVTVLADKMVHNTSDRTGEKRTKGFSLTDSFPKTLY